MEAAQSTVKKPNFLNNDSGNIIAVIAVIGMIAGVIGYWVSLSGKVDSEVRALGSTQSTTFVRTDFLHSIQKSIQGTNTVCPLSATFDSKFKDYTISSEAAKYESEYTDNPATPVNEINEHAQIRCFFNPKRYPGLSWQKVKIVINRSSEPSYVTLSNFLGADVTAIYKNNNKISVLRYQLKYRIDILTMNRYGMIFTNTQSSPVFDISSTAKVKVNTGVLFDVSGSRNSKFPLSNIMVLPDYQQLTYQKEVLTGNRGFTSNTQVMNYLASQTIYDVFKKGIQYGQLPVDASFVAPYQQSAAQWTELLDLKPLSDGAYPLPNTTPPAVIPNQMTPTIPSYIYGGVNVDTNEIYNRIAGTSSGNEKNLYKSCEKVGDPTTKVNLFVFNNLSQDFTIDLTQNTTQTEPPMFCGLIAAKNIIVKLNSQDASQEFYKHHLLGKFILSGKIIVQGTGELNLHDLMDFTEDQVEYTGVDLDINNIRTQFFNQKYYTFQNFFLPFFRPGQAISASNLMTSNERYYVPRGSSAFFQGSCPSYAGRCRYADIPSPAMDDLAKNYNTKVMFEVYSVE